MTPHLFAVLETYVLLVIGAALGWCGHVLCRRIRAAAYTRCVMCDGVGYYHQKPPGLDKVLEQSRGSR